MCLVSLGQPLRAQSVRSTAALSKISSRELVRVFLQRTAAQQQVRRHVRHFFCRGPVHSPRVRRRAWSSPALGECPISWCEGSLSVHISTEEAAGVLNGMSMDAKRGIGLIVRARDEATVQEAEASAMIRLRLVGVTRAEVHVACAPRTVEVRVGGAKPRVFSIDLPGDVEGNTCAFRDGKGAISLRITVAKVQSGSWTENIRVRRRRVKNATSPRTGEVSEPVPRRPADETPASDAEMLRRLADLLGKPIAPPRAASGLLQRLRAAAWRVAAVPRLAFDFTIRVVGAAISRLGGTWARIALWPARRPPALLLALPEDLLEVVLARCPLRDHRALVRTCRDFNRIVAAPDFARVRQRLDVAETVLTHVGGRGSLIRQVAASTMRGPPCTEAFYYTDGSRCAFADLPARRHSAISCFIGAELVVVGGFLEDGRSTSSAISRDLRLDAPSATWRKFPATAAPRGGCAGGVVYVPGPLLVVAGGLGGADQAVEFLCRHGSLAAPHNIVEAFDPKTRRWSRRAPLPVGVCASAAAADGGRLYVVGGQREDKFQACGVLQIYDAHTDTWDLGATLPLATWGASANVVNGRLFVAGGWVAEGTHTRASRNCWMYEPDVDAWSPQPPVRSPLQSPAPGLYYATMLPWILNGVFFHGGDSCALTPGHGGVFLCAKESEFRLNAAAAVAQL